MCWTEKPTIRYTLPAAMNYTQPALIICRSDKTPLQSGDQSAAWLTSGNHSPGGSKGITPLS